MPPCNRYHVGAAAIVAHEGHLLMVKRASTDGDGTWSVPGGWLDWPEHEQFPEDPESAAVRETREETRVWVEPHAAGGHTVHTIAQPSPLAGDAAVTLFVVCRYVHGVPTVVEQDKCPEVEWVPLQEVRERLLFEPLAQWWPINGQYLMAPA